MPTLVQRVNSRASILLQRNLLETLNSAEKTLNLVEWHTQLNNVIHTERKDLVENFIKLSLPLIRRYYQKKHVNTDNFDKINFTNKTQIIDFLNIYVWSVEDTQRVDILEYIFKQDLHQILFLLKDYQFPGIDIRFLHHRFLKQIKANCLYGMPLIFNKPTESSLLLTFFLERLSVAQSLGDAAHHDVCMQVLGRYWPSNKPPIPNAYDDSLFHKVRGSYLATNYIEYLDYVYSNFDTQQKSNRGTLWFGSDCRPFVRNKFGSTLAYLILLNIVNIQDLLIVRLSDLQLMNLIHAAFKNIMKKCMFIEEYIENIETIGINCNVGNIILQYDGDARDLGPLVQCDVHYYSKIQKKIQEFIEVIE
jgi:hypothetical protein